MTERNDPAIREAFRDLKEERLAIMTIDGELTQAEAKETHIESGSYQRTLSDVLK